MGKFIKKFTGKANSANENLAAKIDNRNNYSGYNSSKIQPQDQGMGDISGTNDDYDDYLDDIDSDTSYNDGYNDVGIQPAQKPESFHHFILENKYKDLERSIRGLKDVWDKATNTYKTKRKELHCFTDEESEDILRTAQSHLATDIKLGRIKKESFGDYMDTLYKELAFLFERIAEYRYGRYGSYKRQGQMKLQNQKIFLELFTRIQANYSRSIGGEENKATHNSVKGQESLQSVDRDVSGHGEYN